ncbi:PREDICTED: transcription factor HBP-1b(c38)-like isoform X1 [Nelumbo nucifera]|uniref:Transcription factor HBP-1b(C38)-like isoform X1 n=1 Tax=Nelumbo nucifera TaxID=4432 RepID=A0A1U8B8E4_NELNU|nr:PREDICTED: transcription factor HBP-1b(c38)-like isoform X1 [Nelumbo nucifera]
MKQNPERTHEQETPISYSVSVLSSARRRRPGQTKTMVYGSAVRHNNNNSNGNSFHAFLEGWLVRQQQFLDEIVYAKRFCHDDSREQDLRDLIARVLSHYQQYLGEKSRAAHRDVFLVLSPPWFSSLERALFWIGGFRPGLVFRLVANSVGDLSQDQVQWMETLRAETSAEERQLEEELARLQESVVAPPLSELLRRRGRAVNGEEGNANPVLESMITEFEILLGSADMLRANTATKMIQILSPVQTVSFLAAAAQLQLRIRRLGFQRDAEREEQF